MGKLHAVWKILFQASYSGTRTKEAHLSGVTKNVYISVIFLVAPLIVRSVTDEENKVSVE